jgi:hypothetical protein
LAAIAIELSIFLTSELSCASISSRLSSRAFWISAIRVACSRSMRAASEGHGRLLARPRGVGVARRLELLDLEALADLRLLLLARQAEALLDRL